MFEEQIGKSMEVYIDDMLVKSLRAEDHLTHLQETFCHDPTPCQAVMASSTVAGQANNEQLIDFPFRFTYFKIFGK